MDKYIRCIYRPVNSCATLYAIFPLRSWFWHDPGLFGLVQIMFLSMFHSDEEPTPPKKHLMGCISPWLEQWGLLINKRLSMVITVETSYHFFFWHIRYHEVEFPEVSLHQDIEIGRTPGWHLWNLPRPFRRRRSQAPPILKQRLLWNPAEIRLCRLQPDGRDHKFLLFFGRHVACSLRDLTSYWSICIYIYNYIDLFFYRRHSQNVYDIAW